MKIVIGTEIFCSEDAPIMIVFDGKGRELLLTMLSNPAQRHKGGLFVAAKENTPESMTRAMVLVDMAANNRELSDFMRRGDDDVANPT